MCSEHRHVLCHSHRIVRECRRRRHHHRFVPVHQLVERAYLISHRAGTMPLLTSTQICFERRRTHPFQVFIPHVVHSFLSRAFPSTRSTRLRRAAGPLAQQPSWTVGWYFSRPLTMPTMPCDEAPSGHASRRSTAFRLEAVGPRPKSTGPSYWDLASRCSSSDSADSGARRPEPPPSRLPSTAHPSLADPAQGPKRNVDAVSIRPRHLRSESRYCCHRRQPRQRQALHTVFVRQGNQASPSFIHLQTRNP